MRTATVILPTYNERENINAILDAIFAQSPKVQDLDYQLHVLVVDDSSPDGTGDLVLAYQKKEQRTLLLTGSKQGLGIAYIRGMQYCLEKDYDVVFEMDADFSHDPKLIPLMLSQINAGYDLIIGSRYVEGGAIPQNWGIFRKLNSYGGNLVARFIAGIYAVKDCTSGYRCIHKKVLSNIDFSAIQTRGYGFQVSFLHAAYIEKARILEVPLIFVDRRYGESKLGLSDILEFVQNALAIRLKGFDNFMHYAVVGGLGVGVNLSTFIMMMESYKSPLLSSTSAFVLSQIINIELNRRWTFSSERRRQAMAPVKRVSENHFDRKYFSTKGRGFSKTSFYVLITSVLSFFLIGQFISENSVYAAQLYAILLASVMNYFLNIYWNFD